MIASSARVSVLPTRIQAWPVSALDAGAALDAEEASLEEVRRYALDQAWRWPSRLLLFFCDIHADTDAFLLSLEASGGVERTGLADRDYALTPRGREATFIIGGDCFDKGPENLRLLRCLEHLIELGADVSLLAGNHDLRTYLGLYYAGRRETKLQHLFVRMGKKTMPLFREIWEAARREGDVSERLLDDAEVRRRLFPDDSWYSDFKTEAAGLIPPRKLLNEIARIREKSLELEHTCKNLGMSLGEVYAALERARRMFLGPDGELAWYFERMSLARQEGSFLFVHAGVDDTVARVLGGGGVDALNAWYRRLLDADLFELYHGPLGNVFRTKYRDIDFPLTADGVSDLHGAGIYAIVHGHENLLHGQRLSLRQGVLNFQCDASVDCNTRRLEGLEGPGAAVVIFEPSGRIQAISTDYPFIKEFESRRVFDLTNSDESFELNGQHTMDPSSGSDRSRPRRAHEGIEENVRFLIIEVKKQLQRTGLYLAKPTQAELSKIIDGDDYIDNLKAIIQSKSFGAAAEGTSGTETLARLRTYEVIASNLERVADFCEKVIVQVGYVDSPAIYAKYDFSEFLAEVLAGVGLIERAVMGRDVQVALSICRSEHTIDHMYAKAFKRILTELRSGARGDTQSLVTLLFIAHYLERMGDALLNIGEAILSAHLGERIKIGQLRALEDSLELTQLSSRLDHLSLETMGETRSGARVSSLSSRDPKVDGARPRSVIFKEGKTRKLIEERDSIARWERLVPGLAPQIFSFHDGGEDGAILFEYLRGATFESVLLKKPWKDVTTALDCIQRKLLEVWERTRKPESVAPRFLEQLSARFADVLAVHPEFRHGDARIGHKEVPSFLSLVERLLPYDKSLVAPFSVFIHGDFNVDNVIYDLADDSVRFIDLHRSRMMDYVQDVSVFLVSQFRLQHLETPVRRRINSTILRFHDFARAHAERIGDASFDQRLALGVARSLATSTRFVLDRELARSMFLRSRYVLERLAELHDCARLADYHLTREVLVD